MSEQALIYSTVDNSNQRAFCHWAEGLSMVIVKGDQRIVLDSEEIQSLVRTLPRTFGGRY